MDKKAGRKASGDIRNQQQFADVAAFYIAAWSYGRAIGDPDDHYQKGFARYGRTYLDTIREMLEGDDYASKMSDVGGMISQEYNRLMARRSAGPEGVSALGSFLYLLSNKLNAKSQVRDEIFSDRSGKQAIRALCNVTASEQSPGPLLRKLATETKIRMAGIRKWIEEAAANLGDAVDPMDSLEADAAHAAEVAAKANKIEADLEATDPMSPESADLREEKRTLNEELEEIATNSNSPTVVKAAAVQVKTTESPAKRNYKTQVGARTQLDPDQENAMLVDGLSLIAAGAGSGKTRVLAAKVVYHMQELGTPYGRICACSFTRKSSAELIERIRKFGGDLGRGKPSSFGTTHSVAGAWLREMGTPEQRSFNPDTDSIKGAKQAELIHLAIHQTKMVPSKDPPAYKVESFFDKAIAERQKLEESSFDFEAQARANNFARVIERLIGFYEWQSTNGKYKDSKIKWGENAGRTNGELWAEYVVRLRRMRDVVDELGGDPTLLPAGKQRAFNEFLQNKVKDYVWNWRGYEDLVGYQIPKVAAAEPKEDFIQKKLREFYKKYYYNPANQWFNKGFKDKDFLDKQGRKIPVSQFLLYISNNKGSLKSPTQAVGDDPAMANVFSCVYGAYEWLKNNIDDLAGKSDNDDVLIDAAALFIRDPIAQKVINDKYDLIMVDEAQDLNPAQHLLFGLVAGTHDPLTQEPYEDGRKSVDTYTLIGDDKQAIYEFRGARPEEFMQKSDQYSESGKFKTRLLERNYRSGSSIVNAANQLIAHNDQIKMTCYAANAERGEGSISEYVAEEVPVAMAETIRQAMDGEEPSQPGDFGIGVRTNKEAYQICMALLERGVPFRSKFNPLKAAATKSLIYQMLLAEKGTSADVSLINEVVLEAHKAPNFGIGRDRFAQRLEELAKGQNYLEFLVNGGWNQIYGRIEDKGTPYETFRPNTNWNKDKVYTYTMFLQDIAQKGSLGSREFLDQVLGFTGPYGNLIDQMVESFKASKAYNELVEARKGELLDEDALRAEAMGPVEVLYKIADQEPGMTGFVKYVLTLMEKDKEYGFGDEEEQDGEKPNAVQVDTVHGWKGLECKNMFLTMFEDEREGFPHPLSVDDPQQLESERRLAYVAITRGESSVTIFRPEGTDRSRFVDEACVPDEPFVRIASQKLDVAEKSVLTTDFSASSLGKLANILDANLQYQKDIRSLWGGLMFSKDAEKG